MDTFTVDPEFQRLIPPLAPDELLQLEENLVADGCRDPLVVWDGILLDGHNRYDICRKHELPFRVSHKAKLKSRHEAKAWIIKNQLGRRNLQPFQRVELALLLKPEIEAAAKESQKRKPESVLTKSTKQTDAVHTRKEIAKAAGVSEDTVRKAEHIIEKGTDEQKQSLRTGKTAGGEKTTINKEYQKIKAPATFEPQSDDEADRSEVHLVFDATGEELRRLLKESAAMRKRVVAVCRTDGPYKEYLWQEALVQYFKNFEQDLRRAMKRSLPIVGSPKAESATVTKDASVEYEATFERVKR